MRNKVIIFFVIFLLLLGIIFANSYVQALSHQERFINCNNCEYNENCPIHDKHTNCIKPNNQCFQKKYNCKRSCVKQMCNK